MDEATHNVASCNMPACDANDHILNIWWSWLPLTEWPLTFLVKKQRSYLWTFEGF